MIIRAEHAVPRRAALSAVGAATLMLLSGPVMAKDFKEALAAKEARKQKLHSTAGGIKDTGKDQQVFKDSDYMVSEEARTPNIHSRQGEGVKTQVNV